MRQSYTFMLKIVSLRFYSIQYNEMQTKKKKNEALKTLIYLRYLAFNTNLYCLYCLKEKILIMPYA